jgi:hypothetical protein
MAARSTSEAEWQRLNQPSEVDGSFQQFSKTPYSDNLDDIAVSEPTLTNVSPHVIN